MSVIWVGWGDGLRRTDGAPLITRRGFVSSVVSAAGLTVLGGLTAAVSDARVLTDYYCDAFQQPGDVDSTPSIRRAIEAAVKAGGGRVVASPGRVYGISPQATFDSLNPSGHVVRYPVCIQVPPSVTLDMRGSTLQLLGDAEAVLVANTNLSGTGRRDAHLGLVNAVLDGREVLFERTSLLHLAYVDHLQLRAVKIIRGNNYGGWIYNCRASLFDDLDVDGFAGQPWSIGSPVGEGNQVYDSSFGVLRARNVSKIDYVYLEGNPYDLTLTRCHVDNIEAVRCAAAVKVQFPGRDVTIGRISVIDGGDAHGNGGVKIQGDPKEGPVTGIRVGTIVAHNQTGPGLYLQGSADCTVDSYEGFANNTNGNMADVWIGGKNDHIKSLNSRGSGGIGVAIRPDAIDYQLDEVSVENPGQGLHATGNSGIAVYGGSGALGRVKCLDNQVSHTMKLGVYVNSPEAIGKIDTLEVTAGVVPFKSVSTRFPPPRKVITS